jgi:uncharacterized protein involved in exopolysaccharide biosynthesis
MNDISPLESFNIVLRRWWVLVAAMILGGLAGWALGFVFTPVYEASAQYQVRLDDQTLLAEARLKDPEAELDYITTEKYLGPIELTFYKQEVRDELAALAQQKGLDYSTSDFSPRTFNIDRRGPNWTLVVRHVDPQTAAALANLWMQVTDAHLNALRESALRVVSLDARIKLLKTCLAESSLEEVNQCSGEKFSSAEEAADALSAMENEYQQAVQQSQGITDLVNFAALSEAQPPSQPAMYRSGMLILVGSLLGLIVGAVLLQRTSTRK